MAKRDRRNAKVIVELKDGYISYANEIENLWIVKRKAYEGDWTKIILAILDEKGECWIDLN